MQLILPLLSPPDRSLRSLVVRGRVYQVHIVRHRGARRYLLRVRRDGALRLTVPYGAAIADGLTFAAQQSEWIERERARQDRLAATATEDPRVRAAAARELPARCLELARLHNVKIARVVVRNQRTRWGSCSPAGVIALNWRLMVMPSHVAEYVMLHELMHMRQHNHSRRFWREVEKVCPAWRESERWLRKHGRDLL